MDHLGSSLSNLVKDCCLLYPSETIKRLENRVLMKWFYIQKGFGEPVDVAKCNVNIQLEMKEPMGCENSRDIIYLTLKETVKALKQSTSIIPRTKRN